MSQQLLFLTIPLPPPKTASERLTFLARYIIGGFVLLEFPVWSPFTVGVIVRVIFNLFVCIESLVSWLASDRLLRKPVVNSGAFVPFFIKCPLSARLVQSDMLGLLFDISPISLLLLPSIVRLVDVLVFFWRPTDEDLTCCTSEVLSSDVNVIWAAGRDGAAKFEEDEAAPDCTFCLPFNFFVKFRRVRLHVLITTETKIRREEYCRVRKLRSYWNIEYSCQIPWCPILISSEVLRDNFVYFDAGKMSRLPLFKLSRLFENLGKSSSKVDAISRCYS